MGLEDAVRKMNERTSEYDRLKAQAEQEDKARLIKLVEDFSSAIRRRGVAPIPIHATYTSTDGFTIVTPIVLGGGWMFTVSDEGGGQRQSP
jgi:hypothetical protein